MVALSIESKYPISFRKTETRAIAQCIKKRNSIELIGMKRVGISNFLRYFLNNMKCTSHFVKNDKVLYIPVDLNNLVERNLYAFWLLSFKRLLDSACNNSVPEKTCKEINSLFDKSIQLKDTFFIIESFIQSISLLVEDRYIPVFFFIRFDRLQNAFTHEFFNNVQAIRNASHNNIVYIFTSYKPLCELDPQIFDFNTMSVFTKNIYISPATLSDLRIIHDTYKHQYAVNISPSLEDTLLNLSGGHVQYLQLSLIIVNESKNQNVEEITSMLYKDERIILQSEELFSCLSNDEQNILLKVHLKDTLSALDIHNAQYLIDTGYIIKKRNSFVIFSPYLESYIDNIHKKNQHKKNTTYFTKKENALFELLHKYKNSVCERDLITKVVWNEYEEIGVSDWAIDRLVARLRKKIHSKRLPYEIRTIRTRGFEMING